MSKKQPELEGMEAASIPEIEEAAENYVKLRDKRMKLLEQEITAKANLLTVVTEHAKELSTDAEGNKVYRYDDEMVILKTGRSNVKVKHVQDETDEDED